MSVNTGIEEVPVQKAKRGCWFYTIVGLIVFFLIIIVATGFGLWWLKEHGGTTVAETTYAPQLAQQARAKLDAFGEQIADTQDLVTLTLTEDEINALIAHDLEFNQSGARAEVKFDENSATGRISIPFHTVYLNGMAALDVFTRDGRLCVYLKALEIKGFRAPEFIMKELRKINLAESSKDPGHQRGIDQVDLKNITLTKGQITVTAVAKTPQNEPVQTP